MPPLGHALEKQTRTTRILAYGAEKTKKTTWAAQAAELGFNVLLVDIEDGASVLTQYEKNYGGRLLKIDAIDTDEYIASLFTTTILKRDRVIWDEQSKNIRMVAAKVNPEHSHFVFDLAKATTNDVIIWDSYTALCQSVMLHYSRLHNIDLSDANKTEWPGYGYCGNYLSWVLAQWQKLPCHLIVCAHETVAEKYEGKGADRKLVDSKIIPKSSSNPHSLNIARHFTDILYFHRMGTGFKIDTGGSAGRVGGCRVVPPQVFDFAKFSFKELCDLSGISIPDGRQAPSEAFRWFAPGSLPADILSARPAMATAQVQVPAASTTVKLPEGNTVITQQASGLGGLFGKK